MIVSHTLRFWHSHPFIRLLLPLAVGIAAADCFESLRHLPSACTIAGLFLLWLLLLAGAKSPWDKRARYGIVTFLFFFILGTYICTVHWQQVTVNWPDSARIYQGRLTEGIIPKKNSILCPIRMTARPDNDTCKGTDTNILLYIPKDESASALKAGDIICFYGQVKNPTNFTSAFNYVRYLQHKHVTGTLYTKQWERVNPTSYGWKAKALQQREKLLAYYRQAGIKADELPVLSALTLGYKEELSEDIVQRYSISGANHILALSGLHIGILCMITVSVLGLLIRGKEKKRWCQLLSLPVIWGFVALVGHPVSAVRAATMFSFLIVGNCLTRVGFSLNTLALTGFCMLLYDPFYLFDVGFQMSFSAVAAILMLQPRMGSLIPRPQNAILRYLWSITTVSLSAQIGVMPLIIFYFSRISTYALVVNLWIVPLTFLIICLSVPFILASLLPIPSLHTAMGWCISLLTRFMNQGLDFFNKLPGADISGIELSAGETGCLYAIIFFTSYGLIHRRRRAIIGILGCMCIGVFIRILQ